MNFDAKSGEEKVLDMVGLELGRRSYAVNIEADIAKQGLPDLWSLGLTRNEFMSGSCCDVYLMVNVVAWLDVLGLNTELERHVHKYGR